MGERHSSNHVSLLKVAVHELGHSFNLGHSNDVNDIMYFQYQPNNNIVITDDTSGTIKEIYGVTGKLDPKD